MVCVKRVVTPSAAADSPWFLIAILPLASGSFVSQLPELTVESAVFMIRSGKAHALEEIKAKANGKNKVFPTVLIVRNCMTRPQFFILTTSGRSFQNSRAHFRVAVCVLAKAVCADAAHTRSFEAANV